MTSTPSSPPPRPEIRRPDPDVVASTTRDQQRRRRLPEGAACIVCGESDPVLLTMKGVRRVLEANHVAGRDNDKKLIAPYCLNHHAIMTARQLDVGLFEDGPAPTILERIERIFLSMGIFFEQLTEACFRWAAQITQVMAVLDAYVTGWRTLPGMS
jgi:hypothetical protein